jgi:hypothetical protein
MSSAMKRERRRILAQGCEKLNHGLRVLEQEVDKCKRLFYDLQASWENEVQHQKNERRRRATVVIIQKYICKWLVQCCWRKVLAIREFRRLI